MAEVSGIGSVGEALLTDQKAVHLASARQTFGNVIISILGAGVLGLPFTFMKCGWAFGCLSIIGAGALSYYCMLMLVSW